MWSQVPPSSTRDRARPPLLGLLQARKAIQQRRPTALSNATKFLHKEYESAFFWWEPVEMARRLLLTGGLTAMVPADETFKRMACAHATRGAAAAW